MVIMYLLREELFVSAPDTAFILGAKGIIEGDSLQLSSVVVSEYQGSVTWSIASGSGASIQPRRSFDNH